MKPKKRRAESSEQLFEQRLDAMLDQRQRLYRLANVLPWDEFEKHFSELYSTKGRPGLPIRLMVGLLLLKQLENLSDERVCEQWQRDPYMQYFCGEAFFRWNLPCDPSELVRFRKRIGEWGMGLLLKASVGLHAEKVAAEDEVVADTTVQESNITYPTDTKRHVSCIQKLWQLGDEVGVSWRRRYTRTVPKLLALLRTRSNRLVKDRAKARRHLKTIAGRLLRDFQRRAGKTWSFIYRDKLALIKRALYQKKHDKPELALDSKNCVFEWYPTGGSEMRCGSISVPRHCLGSVQRRL